MPRLLLVFLAVTLLLTSTLVWLSWQLIRQDEALVEQRFEERRETAADKATAALQTSLVRAEEQLRALSTTPVGGLSAKASSVGVRLNLPDVLVLMRTSGAEQFPDDPLPFYPVRTAAPRVGPEVFARCDLLELLHRDLAAAAAVLQPLARASDPLIRAGATMRLARIHRKGGRPRDALAAYETLARLDPATVEGLPAGLVGRHESLALLEALGERQRLDREAAALEADLQRGRWRLLHAEYGFYADAVRRHVKPLPRPDGASPVLVRALAVEWLWDRARAVREDREPPSGRRAERLAGVPVLLLWQATPGLLAGLAVGPDTVQSEWLGATVQTLAQQAVGVALTDGGARPVLGRLPESPVRHSVRPASASSLPWDVHAFALDTGARHAYFDARRRLLLAALLSIALLVLAGTYFLWRLIAREMAVSRLQADFVSAVSHEFRTPLTALRQFSEMLVTGRVAGEGDRHEYYQAMARETARLSRLVERLLDFGRLEAGALGHRLESLDLGALTRDVVADFERNGDARSHRIECTTRSTALGVRGDRETLGCVLWNLLDNAVKYSPEGSTVSVCQTEDRGAAVIRVRDEGPGIPASERELIFGKFFRGSAGTASGVRGAGIGLAMAREIVRAHGGQIDVESVVGQGGVFTVRLPIAE